MLVHGLGGTSAGDLGPRGRRARGRVHGRRRTTCAEPAGSERAAGPYSLDDFVGDLRALAEELELARPALVGHSFGGSVVLAYAARYPGDVSAVVSVGGPVVLPEQGQQGHARPGGEGRERGNGAGRRDGRDERNGSLLPRARPQPASTRWWRCSRRTTRPTYAATCRVLAELDLRPELGRVSAPVLLVAGDRDGVVPPAAGDEIEAALPNVARRVTVEDCGHNLTVERPEVLVDEVRSFLRGRVAARA